uniref:Inositol-pentakisphosphate 2-kinase n=1 Tax=Ditylenchus dipsaci TaxID=166011 RepID=A0A915E299_9BILA
MEVGKQRKSGMMTAKPKCEVVNQYLEKLISPFLGESYLIRAKIVHIPVDRLHHIAKIPALPHNLKIETWEELKDECKYPSAISFFPIHMLSGFTKYILVSKRAFCNNCILQLEKCKSAAFEAMYDFCPLELYSGERHRMHSSIDSLIRDPHRNLRIFVDGNCVHDELSVLPREDLKTILFPGAPADVDTLISVIACTLAVVLSDLLRAQKVDNIGIIRAFQYFQKLPLNIQRELTNKSNLLNRGGVSFLKRSDPRSLVERYLLAATMKDCSLMVSVRLVDHTQLSQMTNVIPTTNPKSAKNLENAYRRFVNGVEAIRANPKIHKPCCV